MEKGVKQESSYPLLVMKRDQTNKTNAEGVYRRWALAWEPGPVLICGYSESGCDLVIQVVHVCVRVGVDWRRSGSGVWKGASQGGGQRGDKRKEGKREVIP